MASGHHRHRWVGLLFCCFKAGGKRGQSTDNYNMSLVGSKSKNKNKKGEKGAPAVEDITTADMADPVKDQDKKADPSTNQPDGAALTDSNPNNRNGMLGVVII